MSQHILSHLILNPDDTNLASADSPFKGEFKKGLEFYQRNYLMTLLESLKNKYPIIITMLGEDNFKFFAREYIYSSPSTNENLDEYGEDFHHFLANRPELAQIKSMGFMAQIDWYWFNFYNNQSKTIRLPQGSLALWQAFSQDLSIEEIVFDIKQQEKINIYYDKKTNEYYLIASNL